MSDQPPNSDTWAAMLSDLEAELRDAEEVYAQAQQRVNAVRRAVAGLRGMLGQNDPPHSIRPALDGRPRGAEAVRHVLQEQPGVAWTVRALTDELGRRGWLPDSRTPTEAVRMALNRAWRTPGSGVVRDGNQFLYQGNGVPDA